MERRIIASGIISVTNSAYLERVELKQGNKSYRLEKIITKALEGQLPNECCDEEYTGVIKLEIKLEKNSIQASEGDIHDHKHSYKELLMEGEV